VGSLCRIPTESCAGVGVTVALPGWHVNYAGEPPDTWDSHLIIVNSASRIFFGGPTQAPSDDILEVMA
jgi:hypothetical protein